MALARTSSEGMTAGAGNFQGVEIPRPLINVQNGAQKKTTTTRRHQEMWRHRIGLRVSTTEENRRPILEAQTPVGPEGDKPADQGRQGEGG